MKKPAAIVIPVYKNEPTPSEMVSLKQCFTIFSKHPIIFIAPDDIDFSAYAVLCGGNTCQLFKFENQYFQSISGYNQLMLSPAFYKRFFYYKYILIYQPDAFVFKDELLYWCKKGYDFIGAPHTFGEAKPGQMQYLAGYQKLLARLNSLFKINHIISHSGNGGFSLRNTRKCYLLLKIFRTKAHKWALNEDAFFNYWGNIAFPFFKLPDDVTALRFAVETNPAEALKKLNGELPFGCHAFEKYDWHAWKPFIVIQ